MVIHHYPASGATWTEGEKGSPLVKRTVFEKALCDEDILEISVAGMEQDAAWQLTQDAAGVEQDARDKKNAARCEASAVGFPYTAGIDEREGLDTPLEQVNRHCSLLRMPW